MSDESDGMEKYAVVEEASSTKTAQNATEAEGTCPICGTALEEKTRTNVLKCPDCGTRPFEGSDGKEK